PLIGGHLLNLRERVLGSTGNEPQASGADGGVHSDTANQSPQLVPVAVRLVFGAVAHEGDPIPARELLDQTERELLTVILDRAAPRINGPVHEQLPAIFPNESGPCD